MLISKTNADILKILKNTNKPVDAIYLTKKVNVNKTTIYRTLENLLKENSIIEIDFGDGKKRYELNNNHHHHIVCKNCGKIEDIEFNEKNLMNKVKQQTNFLIENHSIEFFGTCNSCL